MADDPISDALHAQVYGLFVIGSVSKDGEPNGMTANWVTQVSFDPRIVAVAPGRVSVTIGRPRRIVRSSSGSRASRRSNSVK